ncbi:hypothetical protein IKI14_07300 [bacterium]|nr:hypothetical protein [bacterium]MBR7037581.1 hypothetical protein [bacterium]
MTQTQDEQNVGTPVTPTQDTGTTAQSQGSNDSAGTQDTTNATPVNSPDLSPIDST